MRDEISDFNNSFSILSSTMSLLKALGMFLPEGVAASTAFSVSFDGTEVLMALTASVASTASAMLSTSVTLTALTVSAASEA